MSSIAIFKKKMPNLDRYYLFVWGLSGKKELQYNNTKLLQTKYDRIRRGMANDGDIKALNADHQFMHLVL